MHVSVMMFLSLSYYLYPEKMRFDLSLTEIGVTGCEKSFKRLAVQGTKRIHNIRMVD